MFCCACRACLEVKPTHVIAPRYASSGRGTTRMPIALAVPMSCLHHDCSGTVGASCCFACTASLAEHHCMTGCAQAALTVLRMLCLHDLSVPRNNK